MFSKQERNILWNAGSKGAYLCASKEIFLILFYQVAFRSAPMRSNQSSLCFMKDEYLLGRRKEQTYHRLSLHCGREWTRIRGKGSMLTAYKGQWFLATPKVANTRLRSMALSCFEYVPLCHPVYNVWRSISSNNLNFFLSLLSQSIHTVFYTLLHFLQGPF